MDFECRQPEPQPSATPTPYAPLPSDRHIRLLLLSPGLPGGPLEIKFITCSMDEAKLTYDMVSYSRAKPTRRRDKIDVQFGGISRRISKSLIDMVSMLRHPKVPQRLWVGVICADEKNPKEIDHHTRLLVEIYRRAQQVFHWLGTDSDSIAASVFSSLKHMSLGPEKAWDISRRKDVDTLDESRATRESNEVFLGPETDFLQLLKQDWAHLVTMWFFGGRITWNCSIIWGSERLSLDELVRATMLLHQSHQARLAAILATKSTRVFDILVHWLSLELELAKSMVYRRAENAGSAVPSSSSQEASTIESSALLAMIGARNVSLCTSHRSRGGPLVSISSSREDERRSR